MTPWLSIIGLGEDGLEGLTPAARALFDQAEVLIGGKRIFAMVPEDGRERLTWPSPLSALMEEIAARRGQRVCVLATGDPLHYGSGVALANSVRAAGDRPASPSSPKPTMDSHGVILRYPRGR